MKLLRINLPSGRIFQYSLLSLAIGTVAAGRPLPESLPDDTINQFTITQLESNFILKGFDVTPLPDGQFAVVWAEAEGPDLDGRIYLQRFDKEGAVGDLLTIYDQQSADSGYPKRPVVSADEQGNMVVAWMLEKSSSFSGCAINSGLKASLIGAVATEAQELTAPDVANQQICNLNVAMDADGDFALTWTQEVELKLQTYHANGVAMAGGPVEIAAVYLNLVSDLYMDPNGAIVVAWSEGDASSAVVKARRYDLPSSEPLGEAFRIDHGTNSGLALQTNPSLAADANNGFVAVWMESPNNLPLSEVTVRGQRWHADGSAGAAFELGDHQFDSTDSSAGFSAPSVGADSEGNLLAAWTLRLESETTAKAEATALTGSDKFMGEASFDYAASTGVNPTTQFSAGRVALSDDLTVIVWEAFANESLNARVLPALSDYDVKDDKVDPPTTPSSSKGGGSLPVWLLAMGYLLAIGRRCFGRMG